MAYEYLKANLKKMAEGGDGLQKFTAQIYLHEIEVAKLDEANVVVETKRSTINYLLRQSNDIVSAAIGEYCKAVELQLKTGATILLVNLTPINKL